MTDPTPFFGPASQDSEPDPFSMDETAGDDRFLMDDPLPTGDPSQDLVGLTRFEEDDADAITDGVTEDELTALLGDVESEKPAAAGRKILHPFRAPHRGPPEIRRFVFDSNFGATPPPPPPVEMIEVEPEYELEPVHEPEPEPEPEIPPPPSFSEEELAAARAAAYADGEHAGRLQSERSIENRLAGSLEQISHAIPGLLADRQQVIDALALDSARLAHAIIAKLFPILADRFGSAEIEAVIADGITRALDEPRLVVRVCSARAKELSDRVTELALTGGFEGRVTVVSEDSLGPADVRVEWGDGGAERMTQRAWSEVTAIVDRAVVGLGGNGQTMGEQGQSMPTDDLRSDAAMGSAA